MLKLIKVLLLVGLLVGAAYSFYWATRPLEAPKWMGFAPYDEKLLSPRGKTLWDWFQLLIIPGAIALAVWSLNYAEKKKDREIEEDRQRQTTLDSYFDYMTKLILERNLCSKKPSMGVYCLARTRTMALFKDVDGGRKSQGLQFLYEAGLIYKDPLVRLVGANLKAARLSGATLNEVEITGAYFNNADLKGANLRKAILRGCDFRGADLRDCDLTEADLVGAKFEGAKVDNAMIVNANLKWTDWPSNVNPRKLTYRMTMVWG
jgi:hypothetical protein